MICRCGHSEELHAWGRNKDKQRIRLSCTGQEGFKFCKCEQFNPIGENEMAKKEKKQRKPKGEGRTPRLTPFVSEGFNITASGGGKEFDARVRKDGMIIFKDKEFFSPSAAAKAALPERSIDGWGFWMLKDKDGNRVPLDTLRGSKSPLKATDATPKKKAPAKRKKRRAAKKANGKPADAPQPVERETQEQTTQEQATA